MTTTTSCSKKGEFGFLYRFALRKIAGLTAIYTILLALSYPLVYFQKAFSNVENMRRSDVWTPSFMSSTEVMLSVFLVSFLMCAMVLVVSAVLYSYMHGKQSADFYHSLPVRRETMLLSHFAAGLTAVVIPIWVNGLLASLAFTVFMPAHGFKTMLANQLAWTLGAFILLAISTCVAVAVPTTVENLGYSAAVMVEGGLLYYIWTLNCGMAFSNYIPAYDWADGVLWPDSWLSPIFALGKTMVSSTGIENSGKAFSAQVWGPMLLWTALGTLLLWAAMKLYHKRPSERAQQLGWRSALGFAVKFMSAAIGTFLATVIFQEFFSFHTVVAWILGALVGAPLVYTVVEAITSRGFQNFKKVLPWMGGVTLFMVAVNLYFVTGGLGYDQRVPKADNVESVQLDLFTRDYDHTRYNDNYAMYENGENQWSQYGMEPEEFCELSDERSVELITLIHQESVKQEPDLNYGYIKVSYDTGLSTMRRRVPLTREGAAYLMELYRTPEFLEKNNPFFEMEPDFVDGIQLNDKQSNIIDTLPASESKRLLEAIRQDLLDETPEMRQNMKTNGDMGILNFNVKHPADIYGETGKLYHYETQVRLYLRPSYANTLQVLKELGLAHWENSVENISKVHIFYDKSTGLRLNGNLYGDVGADWYDQENTLCTVEDPELIRKLVDAMTNLRSGNGDQYGICVVMPSPDPENPEIYRTYTIDRSVLLELLKDTEYGCPYILNNLEDEQLRKAMGFLDQDKNSSATAVPMAEAVYNWSDVKTLQGTVSLREVLTQYAPEMLEGKTQVELEAMERMPALDSEGDLIHLAY